jgi:hypothetical protein
MDSRHAWRNAERAALTRTEVMMILFVLTALAAVVVGWQVTALRTDTKRLRCLSNLGLLINAVSLYTQDNHEHLPPNPDDGNMLPGYNWCPGQAGVGGAQEFDPDVLGDGRLCLVAPYLRSNTGVFHCTADPRKDLYQGSDRHRTGTVVPSARTISMNAAVGTVDQTFGQGGGHSGKPNLAVDGPWLDNTHSHHRNRPWRTYGKMADMVAPRPADLFVLIEEDPRSVNDGSFSFGMSAAVWIDWPGALHRQSGVLAFADGHAEPHRWVDSRTLLRRRLSVQVFPPHVGLQAPMVLANFPVPGSDWLWLSQRTSARAN